MHVFVVDNSRPDLGGNVRHGDAFGWNPALWRYLVERFGTKVLEFDGTADALMHPFDTAGRRHMEYVRQRGAFDDMPLAQLVADFAATYPTWARMADGSSFEADVERELR